MKMEVMVISAIASPIVKQIIDRASSLAQKKYQLLQGVEEHVEDISSQLTAIQAVLEDAENKQLDSPPLRDWLQKLKEILQDVEDTLETFETEASLWERKQKVRRIHLPLSATEISFKSDAAHRIQKHLEKIEKISKERHNFQLNVQIESGSNTFDQSRYTSSIVHECDVVGREEDKIKIIDLLLSENSDREGSVSVAPIIGMPGLGKTTLAQLVYNDARVTNHFEFKMWVCVTYNFNYSKVLKDMLEYHTEMTYDLNSFSNDPYLETRLLEFLSRKPFLLVLDDVWPETFQWGQLQALLKNGGRGSRVLVTSRSGNISNLMGTLPPYHLGQLPEEKCWSLFEKTAFDQNCPVAVGGNGRGELEEIGKKIVSKCDGLPLAIRVIGSLLRGNSDAKKWRTILKHKIWDVEKNSDTGKQELLPALNLSYNHLPSHLKRCFSFCCIYPKAYVFRKRELVKMWKAASLIMPMEEVSIDEIGSEYFDRLKSRSFFQLSQVDKEETFRMHDLFHDLAVSVSSPYFREVKDDRSSCNFSEKVRHVSLLCNDVQQPLQQVMERSKKLRTLLSPSDHMKNFGLSLQMVFASLKYIRILDLSSSMMQELPDSVSELKLLHYLDLSRTEIRRLPNSVCNLINLQTLKMLRCLWIFELPQGLGNLTNLQHLELDDMFWYKLNKLPRRMGRITGLQNLHAFQVLNESGYGIDELKDMHHLQGSLHIMKLENAVNAREANLEDKEDLEKVIFEWSATREQDAGVDERTLEDLRPHSNIREVQIVHYLGDRFPSWMREGWENLVSMSLKHCRKCKVLSIGQLRNLRELCLKGLLELEEWVDAPQNLRRLKISNCPELRALPQCFPNLGVMKIKKCNLLKTLPLAPSLAFLILVGNLSLEDFNERFVMLVSINDSQGQPLQQGLPSFINLLELKLLNCPKLAKLPEIFAPQKLDISGCPLLTTLPEPEFSRRFQHLAIDACDDGTLLRAIPDSDSLYSLVISNISSISSLPKWPHLPGLKALYISSCKDLVTLSEEEVAFEGLDSLQLLSIRDCPKLEMLPENGLPKELKCLIISSCSSLKSLGQKELLKSLTSLTDLYIENCPELEKLPEDGFSNSLQHLHIEGCQKLEKRCQEESGSDWPKIMHIPDLEVPSLEDPPQKYLKPWYHRFVWCTKVLE